MQASATAADDAAPAETCPSMEDVRGLYAPAPPPFATYDGASSNYMLISSGAAIDHAAKALVARSDTVFASVAWATHKPFLYALKAVRAVAMVVHAEYALAKLNSATMRDTAHTYSTLPALAPWARDGTLHPLLRGTAFEHVRPANAAAKLPAVRCAGFSKDANAGSSLYEGQNRYMHRKVVIGFRNGAPVGALIGSANATYTSTLSLDAACLFVDPRVVRDALAEFAHLYLASCRLEDAPTWRPLSQTDFVARDDTRQPQIKKRTCGERALMYVALEAEIDRLLGRAAPNCALTPSLGAPSVAPPVAPSASSLDAATIEAIVADVLDPCWLEARAPPTERASLCWMPSCGARPLADKAAAWCSERMVCTCFSAGRGCGHATPLAQSAPQAWVRTTAGLGAVASCTRCVESGKVPCASCAPLAQAHEAHARARSAFERSDAAIAFFFAMQAMLSAQRRLYEREDGARARPHFRLETFAFDGANSGDVVNTYAWVQTDDVVCAGASGSK